MVFCVLDDGSGRIAELLSPSDETLSKVDSGLRSLGLVASAWLYDDFVWLGMA